VVVIAVLFVIFSMKVIIKKKAIFVFLVFEFGFDVVDKKQ